MRKVLVVGEIRDGQLRKVALESLAAAKQLVADGEVVALLVGQKIEEKLTKQMIDHGADRVIIVEHKELAHYTPDGYSQVLLQVITQEKPEGLLCGHTAMGKDLLPKIAAHLGVGLISDVTSIARNDDNIIFTRPIYAGKGFEKRVFTQGFIMATIRPNNIEALVKDETRTGTVSSMEVNVNNIRTIIKEIVRKTSAGVDLSEARVIVAGGRGVKENEGFQLLQELADLLGGAVGASRGACDAGYCDYSLQIGQTGKVVTPELYIACGISGAIQHVAGMSNSKVIVAINKDAEANIFEVADYGIVGDLFEVVPLLIEEFKKELVQHS